MSKRRRRRQKRSFSQTVVLIVSAMIAASMVISLIIVALPGPQVAAPTPLPTWTPLPPPTVAPSPTIEPSPTPDTLPLPTLEPTEPPIGPEPATATPTITPTVTTTPSSANPTLTFAIAGDSRDNPNVYQRVLAAVMDSGSEFLLHTGDWSTGAPKPNGKSQNRPWRAFRCPSIRSPATMMAWMGSWRGNWPIAAHRRPTILLTRAMSIS